MSERSDYIALETPDGSVLAADLHDILASRSSVSILVHDKGTGKSESVVVPFATFQLWASTVLAEIRLRLLQEEEE